MERTGNIRQTTFVETMRGKIVIVFVLISVSLAIMWGVNRLAFEKIASIVKELSLPNEKLSVTRKLFTNVSNLPHLQQSQILKGKGKVSAIFISNTNEIDRNINTLRNILKNEPQQLKRIDSIRSLFATDNRLFLDYLRLRYQLEQQKVFEHQLNDLSEKMDTQQVRIDSNITTSEKKTTITTIIPPDTTIQLPKKKQSWIKRIFKKPVNEVAVVPQQPKVIIEEEVKSQVDTLSVAKADTLLPQLGVALRNIESRRVEKINELSESEEDLLQANNELVHRLLNIVKEVEKKELEQVKEKTAATVLLAGETINRTRLITIIFIAIGLIFSILLMTDAARSRKYRQELEAAKAEAEYHSVSKQRFLSNMSHEIRTPLQSIIGYAEQQLQDGKEKNENVEAIYHSSQHLLQIVNEVLDYSRIISGKFTFENNIFSIKKVAREVVTGLQLLADKKSLPLQLDMQGVGSIEFLKGDAFRLKQVLFNLVGNAIKFTNKGQIRLTIGATRKEERVILSLVVEDSGIGMSRQDLSHIFNQFEQVGTGGRNENGTGLGLSIVKELVEAQQGNITVSSEPGVGSRFQVNLPFLYADAPADEKTPVVTAGNFEFEGKVWLVDDDELILRLGSMILTKYHVPHRSFNTAEKLLSEPWDPEVKVLFADMRLPGIGGAELVTILRKKIPAETRIIALTAQVLPEEKEEILKNGFNQLLLKPFAESDFVGILHQKATVPDLPPLLDLAMLQKMIGDPLEVNSILQQCHEETTEDLAELSEAVEENNIEKTSLIIHRLGGRLGQLGAKKLATQLRARELAIRKENKIEGFKDEIEDLLQELRLFLRSLSTEINAV